MSNTIPVHPIQRAFEPNRISVVPQVMTFRAYEVYCELYGEQPALVTNGCRGGFSVGELLAFLYARSFPKDEWMKRFREGLEGMKL